MQTQTQMLTKRSWIVFVLLFLCMQFIANAQSSPLVPKDITLEQKRYVAPLIYDPVLYPLPIVQLRINGSAPLLFMIDTGYSFPLIIDNVIAKQLKLTANGRRFDIHHGTIVGDMANVDHVEIVCATDDAKHSLSYPLQVDSVVMEANMLPTGFPSPSPIAGIIGMPALSSATVTFDFAAKTLTLLPTDQVPLKIKGTAILSLKPLDTRFTVALPAGDKIIDFVLDTGSQWVVIPEKNASRFKFSVTPPVITGEWSITGLHNVNVRLLSDFLIGNRHEPDVVAHTVGEDEQPSLIGMSVLSRFRMTIDAQHRQLLLEPNTDYAARCRLPGLPCVLVARKQDHYSVYDVLPASSAEQAGVRIGDTILSVDGQSTTALPEETVQLLLDGIADKQAELVLLRQDNSKQSIHYKRQSLFAMASGREIGVGIGIAVTEAGKMLVTALQQRSPATEAGIQVGDEIVLIAGLPVRTTLMAQLAQEMKKPEGTVIILKLLRRSDNKLYEVKLTVRKLL